MCIIKTLHLIVNPTYKDTIFAEICQGEVYTFNGNDYVQTGLYTDSLKTIHGCDSIVTLNLIVYPTYVDTFYMEICQGEQYTFREKDYDQTGIYTDSLKTMYGCDSLLILNLIVHPIYYDTTFVEICQG